MNAGTIDTHRIADLFKECLFELSDNEKRTLPPIVSKSSVSIFTFQTNAYIIISLVDSREKYRLTKLTNKGISPFPELIKPYFITAPSAFAIEKSRNIIIENCSVQKMFSLSLGKDCTAILINHRQGVTEKKAGVSEYSIDLAFLVSYGNEINTKTVYDFIEDLINYFVTKNQASTKNE